MTGDGTNKHSWEQQPSDTTKSFAAFVIYRDLKEERSTAKVAKHLGRAWGTIQQYATRHNWVQRAADYDAYLDQQYRAIAEERHIEDLKLFREKMRDLAIRTQEAAQKLTQRGLERLERRYDEAPGTIASQLRAAAALGELALNQEAAALGIDDLLQRLPESE